MSIYILNYKGESLVSACIKATTWSQYSHTALALPSGTTIEAWHKGGVLKSMTPWEVHTPKTEIDIFEVETGGEQQVMAIWAAALAEVGKPYDFRSLTGFIPGIRLLWKDDPDKWFCSHLAAYACLAGGRPLFSSVTPLYKISPGLIAYAAPLKHLGTAHDIRDFYFVTRQKKQPQMEGESYLHGG